MSITVVGTALATLGVNTREWTNGLNKAQKQMQSFAAGVQVNAFRLTAAWTATAGVLAGLTLKIGGSFEREFTGVRKTVKGTEEEFGRLKKQLLDVSRATTFTADELSILARKGGQLGIATENLANFTEVIAKLGLAAAELPAEEAATGLARLMAVTGTGQEKIGELASVLARLGDSFATNESRILNFSQRIAGLSKVAGITANDTLAMGAAFTATVPGVELVATQLSKGMAMFANAVASGGDKLKVLDKLVEHTGASFTALFRTDSATAIAEFLKGLDNVRTSGGNAFATLRDLGLTNQRAAQAFLAAAGASDQFKKALVTMRDEVEKADTAEGKLNMAFKEQMQTFEAQMAKVQNIFSIGFIKLFDSFKPAIMGVVSALEVLGNAFIAIAEATAAWPDSVKAVIVVVGLLITATLGLSLVLGAVGSTLLGLKASVAAGIALWKSYTVVKVAATAAESGWVVSARSGGAVYDASAVALRKFTESQKVATTATIAWGSAIKSSLVFLGKFAVIAGMVVGSIVLITESLGVFHSKITGNEKEVDKLAQKMATIMGNDARMAIAKQTGEWERLTKQMAELRKETSDVGALFPQISEELRRDRAFDVLREDMKGVSDGTRVMINAFEEAGYTVEQTRDRLQQMELQKLTQDEESAAKAAEEFRDRLKEIGDIAIDAAGGVKSATEIMAEGFAEVDKQMEEGILTRLRQFSWYGEELFGSGANSNMDGVFAGLNVGSALGGLDPFGGPRGIFPEIDPEKMGFKSMTDKFVDTWAAGLKIVNKMFKAFGVDANSAMGAVISSAIQFASIFSTKEGKKQFMGGGILGSSLSGTEKLAQGGMAAAGGIASWLNATGSGSRGQRVAGGAMAGAAAGGQIGGPIGSAVGAAAGAIAGLFRGKKVLGAISEVAKKFGKDISEELAKALVESSKELGSLQNAMAANLGDILEETGINEGNLASSTQAFSNLIGMVQNGTMTISDATEQINKSFGIMVEYLETMGTKGALEIGKLVQAQMQMGVMTEESKAFLKEQASTLRSDLAPALEWIGTLTDITAEEAVAFGGIVVASWGAAVAETGSFVEAVKLLGEEFGNTLNHLIESMGPEGEKIIGPIAHMYNLISENQGAFDALHGIASGLESMAKMGILTTESLQAMGAAAEATFNRLLQQTGDYNMTLKASWPDLLKMRDYYQEMGVALPAWLDEAINKGKEMGLSMEVPLTTIDALNAIVKILGDIARQLGAVGNEAVRAGNKIGNMPRPPSSGNYRKPGNDNYATGGLIRANPPQGSVFIGGEKEDEYVVPKSTMESIAKGELNTRGGGNGPNITVNVNAGNFWGTPDEFARTMQANMGKWIRNNDGGLQSDILDVTNRG